MFSGPLTYFLTSSFVQAVIENTRAYDILQRAPFLVPFTSRVKIFTVSDLLITSWTTIAVKLDKHFSMVYLLYQF